jgi:hypothetical protein
MTSSVDPRIEIANIKARLDALSDGITLMGTPQGFVFPLDDFGHKLPYRDLEPGSMIPSAGERLLAASEQAQPYIFAFQIHHFAYTRELATNLSIASDMSLIGWTPSEFSGTISAFFFNMYDEFNKDGETVGHIATRFYNTTLGQQPDMSL